MKPILWIYFPAVIAVGCTSGCTSTSQRAALVGGASAAGAAAGYAVAPKNAKAIGAAAGGLVGGMGAALAMGPDPKVYQRGLDDGYMLASADDIKRLFWAKAALEKRDNEQKGVMRYYTFEDEGTTKDGRKLAPEKIAIPVYEPERP